LAYTGTRRGEIGKLEKSHIKFDEDSQRYYFLLAEGGQGKTENATRQVVIHPKLIEWGFMEYVDRQWKELIFSEVAGTNMTKIGKYEFFKCTFCAHVYCLSIFESLAC
jgi:integrase